MQDQWSKAQRACAGAISLAAFATLALQTSLNLERDGSSFVAFALLFRYFTIWSNFATGVIMALIFLNRRVPRWVIFALATALTHVGLVYHALLASTHYPVGLDVLTNQMFHTVIPVVSIFWWLAFSDRHSLTWRSLPYVMIAPIIYTAFALFYGEISGFYPYFFLELPKIGWAQLALNITGLAMFFVVLGSALLALRKLATKLFQRPRLSTR